MAAIKDFKRTEREKKAKHTLKMLRSERLTMIRLTIPPDKKQMK